jgi:hypothetical protein
MLSDRLLLYINSHTSNACEHALCPVLAVQTPDAVSSSKPCVVQLS